MHYRQAQATLLRLMLMHPSVNKRQSKTAGIVVLELNVTCKTEQDDLTHFKRCPKTKFLPVVTGLAKARSCDAARRGPHKEPTSKIRSVVCTDYPRALDPVLLCPSQSCCIRCQCACLPDQHACKNIFAVQADQLATIKRCRMETHNLDGTSILRAPSV